MNAVSKAPIGCLEEITEFDFTVPEDYQRETYTDLFHKKYDGEFYSISTFLMEKARKYPPVIISSGMHLRASIVKTKERILIEECLKFLKDRRALLLGTHGILLAYDLAKENIPLDVSMYSFDQEHLSCRGGPRECVLPMFGCLYKQWLLLEDTAYSGLFEGKAFFCFQAVPEIPESPDRSGDTAFA